MLGGSPRNAWKNVLCPARPSPNLRYFIWESVYPERVLLYPSQGRPTVSHPAAFKRPPPALNQTTCEINITLTHVSNSWCQSQTERVKRKKRRDASEGLWAGVGECEHKCTSFFTLVLAHLLISASSSNLEKLKWLWLRQTDFWSCF